MSSRRSVELTNGQWVIDGTPRILFCGEVHYFRLQRSDWRPRLEQLKAAGAQAVASYMPWLVHELPDGTIDVTGTTEDWRDLGAFCDLAAELGLYVIARPGPFVMAELKNEGIPYRIYDLPGVVPTTWDDRPLPTRDVDYLSPVFLSEVGRWYDAVLPVLAERLHDRGGPVIAVQLDNEVGMLAWVSNSPAISDQFGEEFLHWWETRDTDFPKDGLVGLPDGVGLPDRAGRVAAYLRRPPAGEAVAVTDSLMRFCRARFTRYTDHLANLCREHAIDSVPFLINIHGTGQGRGLTYPIGISQLLGTWRNRTQVTAGSDMYLGDLTVNNVADFVIGNIFARAVQGRDQPLTALEFEAGDGDYGQDLSRLVPPEAVGLRTRLAHGLGNRLMNYYLFAGGVNPSMPPNPDWPDGLDRIAFTGEHHGFAAPIGPTGDLSPGYTSAAEVMSDLNAVQDEAATMEPYADVTLGFVSDHYLTEYRVPEDEATAVIQRDLERFRGMGTREVLARALVLGGVGLDAVDLCTHPELDELTSQTSQDLQPPELSVSSHPVLALASAHHLAADVQQRLAEYVHAGGRLLLAGVLPTWDQHGGPCSILADAFGIQLLGERGDQVQDAAGVEHPYFTTVQAVPGWLTTPRPEVRAGHAQLLRADGADVLLTEVATGQPCAVDLHYGEGRVIILAADYPCDLDLYATLITRLGVQPHWSTDAEQPGLVLAGLTSADGATELLHVVNVAPYPITATISRDGLAGRGPITIAARGGLLFRYVDGQLQD